MHSGVLSPRAASLLRQASRGSGASAVLRQVSAAQRSAAQRSAAQKGNGWHPSMHLRCTALLPQASCNAHRASLLCPPLPALYSTLQISLQSDLSYMLEDQQHIPMSPHRWEREQRPLCLPAGIPG